MEIKYDLVENGGMSTTKSMTCDPLELCIRIKLDDYHEERSLSSSDMMQDINISDDSMAQ